MEPTAVQEEPDVERRAGAPDQVTIFRELIGIFDVSDATTLATKRKARNIGIYRRVVNEERKVRIQYLTLAALINACLLLQVVFATVLTSLGASSSSHIIITVFGALNTIIAAFLSFTKGQGLPNRLRLYQSNLRKVREHIELSEREFSQRGCTLEVGKEVHTVIQMYEKVRKDHENNHPDTYAPSGAPIKGNSKSNGPGASNHMSTELGALAPFFDRLKARKEANVEEDAERRPGDEAGASSS